MTDSIVQAGPLHPDDFVVRQPEEGAVEVGGRWVVMGVEQGDYVELNSIGVEIWNRIAEERSIVSLAAEIAQLYGTDVAIVTADVARFLAQLRDQQLITVRRTD